MEKQVFLRRKILFDRLEKFGFIRIKEGFSIERDIYPDMIAKVVISLSGDVSGEVYDRELQEPYVLFRDPAAEGAFVIGVRNAYLRFLEEIADAVSEEKQYAFPQSNRVNEFIYHRYQVSPEYLWARFPHFGVYRNKRTKKWFAIIMNISKAKVISGANGEVEVMNVKTDERTSYFIEKGAYPSYHMNHRNWITLILDDSLSDDVIKEALEVSFTKSDKKK